MLSAREALAQLKEGNRRFVAGEVHDLGLRSSARRAELISGQSPHTIILGCSDSRVPAEIVFDQGLGDLFVIRVAGNIVAPSQVGSIEFAAEHFGTRLVVVMGHTNCGAVTAAIQQLEQPRENRSRNLRSIVDRIRPAVETLMETDLRQNHDDLIRYAVRANIRAAVSHLRYGSEVLEHLFLRDGLLIVGAEYSLETGEVIFFDDGLDSFINDEI